MKTLRSSQELILQLKSQHPKKKPWLAFEFFNSLHDQFKEPIWSGVFAVQDKTVLKLLCLHSTYHQSNFLFLGGRG